MRLQDLFGQRIVRMPPQAVLCPNPPCRSPNWTEIKPVKNAFISPGQRPEQVEVGSLVECVQCGTIYSVLPSGSLMAPSFTQPGRRSVSSSATPALEDREDQPPAGLPDPDEED